MKRVRALAATVLLIAGPAAAAEGFWPLDAVPVEAVRQATGVTLERPFIERLQAATVRLASNGCSAALVSREGLALTNHHCVLECVRALSDETRDPMQAGFLTASRADERACPGMAAEVLVEITDVTRRVQAAPRDERDTVLAAAERDACAGLRGYRCYGISFFRGGRFKVYRYRRYEDVRLVFAPEFAATFFGGDPDNFNFPRHSFDAAFLRLYDDGRPARTREHLILADRAPVEGEPVFLVGNPGATERLLTVAQLETLRDVVLPVELLQLAEFRGRLIEFGKTEAGRRVGAHPLYKVENAFKIATGRHRALSDPRFMAAKRAEEDALRARVAADPKLAAEIGDPWAEAAGIQAAFAAHYLAWRQVESQPERVSRLFAYARTLVRGAQERELPSDERRAEFIDSRLSVTKGKLLAGRPIEPAIERMALEHWLLKTRELLGPASLASAAMLGEQTPEGLARRLVEGTRLADPAVRERLWQGGLAAIEASDDPMIELVRAIDPLAEGYANLWARDVDLPTQAAAERIARARFAVFGDSIYPDATFSPRLSYGKVEGWSERGRPVWPFTTIGSLYRRATGVEPYVPAPRWIAAREALNPATLLNFTASTEVVGGSSGSPVIDARGAVIGVAFDGNIHSLGGAYGYDPALNRTIAVATEAVIEALDKVYGRHALVKELTGR